MEHNDEFELMITIFTTETYQENKQYCQRENLKCLYSSSVPISNTVEPGKKIFVLEADNTTNKIRGIGYIKNVAKTRAIYGGTDLQKHNGYVYVGRQHYCRDERQETMSETLLFDVLEQLCFYGKSHLKRFQGIQRFPTKWIHNLLKRDYNIVEQIIQIFKQRYYKTIKG